MFNYTAKQLLQTRDFFRKNPNGRLTVNHPGWFPQYFTKGKWLQWFRESLLHKCGGLRYEDLNDRQRSYLSDAMKVQEYLKHRRRFAGRNILSSPQMKRRFPMVDNYNPFEDY